MIGAPLLLLVVVLLYATSLLVLRFATGKFQPLKQPVTWFYASWVLGLVLLALPIYEYQEQMTVNVLLYISSALACFSIGSIGAAFAQKIFSGARKHVPQDIEVELRLLRNLMYWLVVLGIFGTSLLVLNTMLSGGLSIAERLNSDNAAQIRLEFMAQSESKIGPLYGPANALSALGGVGVALVMYFMGACKEKVGAYLKWLSFALLAINCFGSYLAFGSRMFAVFSIVVASLSFVFGCWSRGRKAISLRLNSKKSFVTVLACLITVVFLWFSATYFLEKRVGGQSPSVLLYKTHRANFSKELYGLIRADTTTQYLVFSASYFSTPITTLAFYLDLPDDRYPGPFWGQYNFPAVARWVRRILFMPDPFFWDNARYEIFKPLGDVNFGTNVWPTALRDLIADFGKIGSLFFVAGVGFLVQLLMNMQFKTPTAVRAALLVYLMIFVIFSGFVSTLFMPQIHWPLYVSGLLIFTKFNGVRVVGKNIKEKVVC